jgi:hypothetical protein
VRQSNLSFKKDTYARWLASVIPAVLRRIAIQGWPWAKVKPYPKNKLKQKGLGAWLEW